MTTGRVKYFRMTNHVSNRKYFCSSKKFRSTGRTTFV